MEPDKDTLTTGEIAKYCGVNFRTVIRWIEKGYLKSYKLPGRGDNRVPVAEFRRFLEAQGMPVPSELGAPAAARILIVDDDESVAASIRRVLRRAGYEVEWASNGVEAGMALERFKPALITLDLQMPQMDGFGLLKILRQHPTLSATRVIVISGMASERLEQALAQGADRALGKPFNNELLIRYVGELLGA